MPVLTPSHVSELKKVDERRYNERYMPLCELVDLLRNVKGELPSNDKINQFLVNSGLKVYELTPQSKVLLRRDVERWIEKKQITC